MATCVATSTGRLVAMSSSRVRKTGSIVPVLSGNASVGVCSPSWSQGSALDACSPVGVRNSVSLYHSSASSASSVTCALPQGTPAVASVLRPNGNHQEEEQNIRNLLLSSALVSSMLGFMAVTTSHGDQPQMSTSGPKFTRKGGGGGGGHRPMGPMVDYSKKNAEEDVRILEEEAVQNPYTVSVRALQGPRWTMEDAFAVENGGRFVAVFDGHGGADVSGILRDRLFDFYSKVLCKKHWEESNVFEENPKKRIPSISSHVAAVRGALAQVEEEVLKHDDLMYQGSTAVAVIMHVGEDGRRTLLSANVGDSRAILSRNKRAVDLTRDHKPNDEQERARIHAKGAEIEWDPYGQLYRVCDLSLSRAIGDRFAKPVVSSEAEIKHFPVADDDDEFIILASDGLWDVMTSQEAVDFVHESLSTSIADEKAIALAVANEALDRGSADNVCVLVVWLKK